MALQWYCGGVVAVYGNVNFFGGFDAFTVMQVFYFSVFWGVT